MLDRIQAELFPLLGWMKNLKSLVILRNGHSFVHKEFIFMEKLIGWLLPQLLGLWNGCGFLKVMNYLIWSIHF